MRIFVKHSSHKVRGKAATVWRDRTRPADMYAFTATFDVGGKPKYPKRDAHRSFDASWALNWLRKKGSQ